MSRLDDLFEKVGAVLQGQRDANEQRTQLVRDQRDMSDKLALLAPLPEQVTAMAKDIQALKDDAVARKARAGVLTAIATGAGGVAGWVASNWHSLLNRGP